MVSTASQGVASATLRLAACRAVLAGEVPAELAVAPGTRCVEMRPPHRATAPGASYAVEAVGALDRDLGDAAVFTFAGPPGSALHLFEAGRESADGPLVSAGFGRERSRRIHPFTVLLALQNQVAATLSLELGLRGPCCSTTDAAAAFVDLLPNMAMAMRDRPVLAVFASAANRAEHRTYGIHESGIDVVGRGSRCATVRGGRRTGERGARRRHGRALHSAFERALRTRARAGPLDSPGARARPRLCPIRDPRAATHDRVPLEPTLSFVDCVTTALPPHQLSRDQVRELARSQLHGKVAFLDQALALFDNAGVESRRLVREVDVLLEHRSLEWRNNVYVEECRKLGIELLGDLLEQTSTRPEEIDLLITTSCTGFMIPALDADLINHFRLRSDVRRLPFTELGCAAGAMSLSRAHDHLRAYPDHKVAIIAVEIPSMTFLSGDLSVANLVSAALFGDGGAAALMRGDRGRFEILDARTHFFHDTPEMMGFRVTDEGFSIVLDKRVPQLLERELPAAVERLPREQRGRARATCATSCFHPGGRKILDTVHDLFGLADDDLALSRETLREVGNLSSASVLFVLEKALARPRPARPLVDGGVRARGSTPSCCSGRLA